MKKNKYIIATIILALFAIFSIFFIQIMESDSSMNNENITTKETTLPTTTPETESATEPIEETTVAPVGKAAKHLIDFNASHPFLIKVNRVQNYVIIYGLDKKGRYSIPYKIFSCSVGFDIENTPTGAFNTSDYYPWRLMVDGSYAQYAIRINGSIMLHSVPYYKQSPDSLESEEYNKLGTNASLGCIRLNVKSIQWIYNHCPKGTSVLVYDSATEVPPLKIKKTKKLDLNDSRSNWDPTDPDSRNPWNQK